MNPHLGRNPDAMLVRGPPGAAKDLSLGRNVDVDVRVPSEVRRIACTRCQWRLKTAHPLGRPPRGIVGAISAGYASWREDRTSPYSCRGRPGRTRATFFWCHSRRTSEHRPFHPRWRGLGRERASYRPRLTWGCPPLVHSASLHREIGTMDKAWTTPPTAVPRADVDCDAIVAGAQRSHTSPKTSPDSKGESAGPAPSKHRPFHAPRAGLPGASPSRLDPVGRAGLPAQVETVMVGDRPPRGA